MQPFRKTSFVRTLFRSKRRETSEPKKAIEPLDKSALHQVAGGTTTSPRGQW
jgi:hypothetical protein